MTDRAPTQRAIEAVWRLEAAKLVAGLTRHVRDVGVAEELAQDAFVAAMQQWPTDGIPDRSAAWLMAAAKRRAIDRRRRDQRAHAAHESIARDEERREEATMSTSSDAALDGDVEDDLLRLVFMACHPVLPPEARSAITLRLVCGLTTAEIARAFLVPEPTIAQRIARAKRTLTEQGVPFEVPRGSELASRVASVLEVVYLVFNEGYTATSGDRWLRAEVCDEAMRLGRIVAGLMPDEAEAHGLVALMELQASRTAARVDASGKPVLLLDQDRARWDRALIRHGLAALGAATRLRRSLGPYSLQASIAACHAQARAASETDWPRIAALYGELQRLLQSPVVELNRAVAVAMAEGPAPGLAIADALRDEPALREYHLLPAVRGDLLSKLGRHDEARAEFERAAALTRNDRERELLLERARTCKSPTEGIESAGSGD